MAAAGYYAMAKDQLERFRAAVDDDGTGAEIAELVDALSDAGYTIGAIDELKTAPRGYPKDHPRIELLRRKGLMMCAVVAGRQVDAHASRRRQVRDGVAGRGADVRLARRPRRPEHAAAGRRFDRSHGRVDRHAVLAAQSLRQNARSSTVTVTLADVDALENQFGLADRSSTTTRWPTASSGSASAASRCRRSPSSPTRRRSTRPASATPTRRRPTPATSGGSTGTTTSPATASTCPSTSCCRRR